MAHFKYLIVNNMQREAYVRKGVSFPVFIISEHLSVTLT